MCCGPYRAVCGMSRAVSLCSVLWTVLRRLCPALLCVVVCLSQAPQTLVCLSQTLFAQALLSVSRRLCSLSRVGSALCCGPTLCSSSHNQGSVLWAPSLFLFAQALLCSVVCLLQALFCVVVCLSQAPRAPQALFCL